MHKRQAGFSLVEVVMAIVAVSVGLAGVLMAFRAAAAHSADPLIAKQMLMVAEGVMEEIMLRPYTSTPNTIPITDCAREAFNDVGDYNGYATAGRICTVNGTAIPALSSYSVSVSVIDATLAGIAAKRVVVTASHGNDSVSLTSYKADL